MSKDTQMARLEGSTARFSLRPVDECPYDTNPMMFAWLLGWYETDEEMEGRGL